MVSSFLQRELYLKPSCSGLGLSQLWTLGLERPGNVGFLPDSRMELEAFPRAGSGSLGRSPQQV